MPNPDQRLFEWDLGKEIDRYFDASSVSNEGQPRIVLLLGGPAAGKTSRRKECYSTGYVLVDAADIFLNLTRGEAFEFPDGFEEPMDLIGRFVAHRAVLERRNIVTELIGSEFEPTRDLIDAMRAIGYVVCVEAITCDIEEAVRRNLARGDDNISCYYAEPYQRRWLQEAARTALGPEDA
jgi:chloramphenicol 3-O-phosphotransferase